jgi:DNA topoisomerase-2
MAWTNNMSKQTPAEITDYAGEDYTKVTFSPDLARFKMKELSSDMISLFQKRVVSRSARRTISLA